MSRTRNRPGRLVVLSPHLDDAVFACGRLLASYPGAQVLTVFAGLPSPQLPLTEWDRSCGFAQSVQAMRERRAEDATALALLGATPIWLDFLDAQYAPTPSVEVVAETLCIELDRLYPDTLLIPLGLFHSDHRVVHEAVIRHVPMRGRACYAYEDALYRRLDHRLSEQLFRLRRAHWHVARHAWPESEQAAALKRQAVQCYRSQLAGLTTPGRPGHEDLERPEGYWRLTPQHEQERCIAFP